MIPKLIAFDLDGTLAESKQAIETDMALTLTQLLAHTDVAITSGGMLAQLKQQVVDELPPQAHLENLYLLPTSGAALFEYHEGEWFLVYEERLTQEETEHIEAALEEGATQTGLIDFSAPAYGDRIEIRGAQVSLSALGQEASAMGKLEEKRAWDPTHEKRKALQSAIAALLPKYDVKIGGLTTIDVTKKNINKAFGIRELSKHLAIPIEDMLYVGDELAEGGNDSVVLKTGIKTISVTNPSETRELIQKMLDA